MTTEIPFPGEGDVHGLPKDLRITMDVLQRGCPPAAAAAERFFLHSISNVHTRTAYAAAVRRFLSWIETRSLHLNHVKAPIVAEYFNDFKREASLATRKQHLSALTHFLDALVVSGALLFNPAASVREERQPIGEGSTPAVGVEQARTLLTSIEASGVVNLRDRAILGTLLYTACRAGAVSRLRLADFYVAGNGWKLHLIEKRGRELDIAVRPDLEQLLRQYIVAAGLEDADGSVPLFRAAAGRSSKLTDRPITVNDLGRMVKRRLRDAGLPLEISTHSFRVGTITNLLEQGAPLSAVQQLAGHADPRTTQVYDRRTRMLPDNIVTMISF